MFVLLALGLTAVVVMLVWWQLARAARQANAFDWSREEAVETPLVQVYREQLAELSAQRERGEIDALAFDQAKAELDHRLLADVQSQAHSPEVSSARARASLTREQTRGRGLAWSLLLLIPMLSVSGYVLLGRPLAIVPEAFQAQAQDEVSPQQLAEMAAGLRSRLDQDPSQAEGWVMLARVERARGQWDEAFSALSRAQALSPSHDLTLERAEWIAQQQSGRFDGEPWALIRSVLRQDPRHLGALVLAGSASFNAGQLTDAEGYWTAAREQVPPGSAQAQPLDDAIAQVRVAQGKPAMVSAQPLPSASPTGPSSPQAVGRIEVRVEVSEPARAAHQPQDVVFVYAQAAGSRMPVAVAKTTLGALPSVVVLDDSLAMAPGNALSGQAEVKVSARISRNGQAVAQPGDWGASQGALVPQAQPKLTLKITGPLP